MINFKLLTIEDVQGKNKLSIFNKVPCGASVTDFAKYNIDFFSRPQMKIGEYFPYYLDSFSSNSIPFLNTSRGRFETKCNMFIKVYASDNAFSSKLPDDFEKIYGIRLKVDYDEVKKHIISDIYGNQGGEYFPYKPSEKGVIELLAFEYPKKYLPDDNPIKEELELLYEYKKLEPYKEFDVRGNGYQSYEYKGSKYVRVDGKWITVEPIVWYYDEEQNVLVSKDIIIGGINVTNESFFTEEQMENFKFEDTLIFNFLQRFSKDCLMDEYSINLYGFPFYIPDIDYRDDLNEIKQWEKYYDDRQLRKNYLQEIRKFCLESKFDDAENIKSLIDKIEKMNKEDEILIEEKYSMLEETKKVRSKRKK